MILLEYLCDGQKKIYIQNKQDFQDLKQKIEAIRSIIEVYSTHNTLNPRINDLSECANLFCSGDIQNATPTSRRHLHHYYRGHCNMRHILHPRLPTGQTRPQHLAVTSIAAIMALAAAATGDTPSVHAPDRNYHIAPGRDPAQGLHLVSHVHIVSFSRNHSLVSLPTTCKPQRLCVITTQIHTNVNTHADTHDTATLSLGPADSSNAGENHTEAKIHLSNLLQCMAIQTYIATTMLPTPCRPYPDTGNAFLPAAIAWPARHAYH